MDAAARRRRRRRRLAWGMFILGVVALALGATVYGLIHADSLRDLKPEPPRTTGRAPDAPPRPAPPPPLPTGKLVGVMAHPLWSDVDDAEAARMLDLAHQSGANTIRMDIGWASLEPDRPGELESVYTGRADRFIRAARMRGLAVIVTLLDTPCWASSAPEDLRRACSGRWWERGVTAYPPRDPGDYAAAARAVARRWGGDIVALEIWNEPNLPFFWRSDDPAGDYGALLRAAYGPIKAERPDLTVLGGSLAYADGAFLEQLYDRGRIRGHYDAIAIHPYTLGELPADQRSGDEPRRTDFRDGVRWVRRVMRSAGDPRPRLWLTEVGASTCPADVNQECVSEADQARYVTQAVQTARRWSFVDAVVVYSLLDGADPAKVVDGYGLATRDGRPKAAFDAFRQAAR
jgi:hypothetical protein